MLRCHCLPCGATLTTALAPAVVVVVLLLLVNSCACVLLVVDVAVVYNNGWYSSLPGLWLFGFYNGFGRRWLLGGNRALSMLGRCPLYWLLLSRVVREIKVKIFF